MLIRPAEDEDIPTMAQLRSEEWGEPAFWIDRITRYRLGEHSPRLALPERGLFVAVEEGRIVGLIAGHRTRRLECEGELQWVNVAADKRGRGIAGLLLAPMRAWFVEQKAQRICVNVDPKNEVARRLYSRWGARPWNESWMLWDDARCMGLR